MTRRVAVIGAGRAATRHATLARLHWPDATIAVVRRAPTTPAWADVRLADLDALAGFAPTLGVVAGPAPTHVAAARSLLDAGAFVLLEKPVSAGMSDATELLNHGQAHRVLTGYNLRFTSGLDRLATEMQTGTIGRPLITRAEVGQWLPAWRPGTDHRRGTSAQVATGGGALLELSHELHALRWLLGPPEWVAADVRRIGSVTDDADDVAHVTLGVDGGVATMAADLLRRDACRLYTAIGDEATVSWDAVRGRVSLDDGTGARPLLDEPDDLADSYGRQWRHFLAAAAGDEEPRTTLAEGVAVVALVEACRESARTHARVTMGMPR